MKYITKKSKTHTLGKNDDDLRNSLLVWKRLQNIAIRPQPIVCM